jgi:aminotransferase
MLRQIISERERELPPSILGKLLHIASEDKSIISLGPGEPDFDAPENIIRAAKKRLDQHYTHYSAPNGRTELREEIAKKLKRENRIRTSPEQIIVTAGSTEAIMLALMCTTDPGEGVMVPDPGFLAYKPTVEVLNGMPINVPLHEKDGFEFNPDVLKELVIPEKTNAIIINTPSNPTGTVFSRKVLEEIADFAIEYDILVISDEAYEKFVYGGAKHISIGSFNGMEKHVMTLHSFSKTYAMPGFRVGYAAGPQELIAAMSKLHLFTSICASTLSQMAALDALKGPQGSIAKMAREYDRRRKMIVKRANEIPGLHCIEPMGAFYAFPNISGFHMGSQKFAEFLLEKAKVAVVPGVEFGRMGEGYIRLSYATAYSRIGQAMDNIEKAVKGIV